jgi:hypothetical protein
VISVSGYRIAPPLSTPSSRLPRFSITARAVLASADYPSSGEFSPSIAMLAIASEFAKLQAGVAAHYVTQSGFNEAMSLTLPHITRCMHRVAYKYVVREASGRSRSAQKAKTRVT